MKTTTREFSFVAQSGQEVKIVATYVSNLTISPYLAIANCPTTKRDHISTAGSSMIAYVDGKRVKECRDPWFWQLIDSKGLKKIWGLPIAFSDSDKADAYNAFLADLMQDDDEVIAFRAATQAEEQRKRDAEDLAWYKQVVAACESGYLVETVEEAEARQTSWNNVVNEGGSGYVPTWHPRALYERALAYIAQHTND